jgi:1-pyrroline-5-carboxylate dehydrogenase
MANHEDVAPYKPQSLLDFSKPENARWQKAAIERVRLQLGREHDLVIGGERSRTAEKIVSINPSRPDEVVGVFQKAGAAELELAMKAATSTFSEWSRTPAAARAQFLLRIAEAIGERRFEWNAWLILEAGKNWIEADADTAETIDFANFYAREMLRLETPPPVYQLPGERDEFFYRPLGVGAVIPPWNFPSAIMAGMTMAAIVTGNTVILKPSSDAPAIAHRFLDLLEELGLPAGVVNFCTGAGADFGNALVEHPRTRFISFTGSREAGLQIHQRAAVPRHGQRWIKRTVLEMGGKDAIIVDACADTDHAVEGIIASAFGYQGQKCSACSRAIVDERIYGKFVERLRDAAARLTVGEAELNPSLGPVINAASRDKILGMIKKGLAEGGRLICGGHAIDHESGGYFLEPTIIADVAPGSTIEQQEIFGPVLAVIPAKDFDDALRIANDSEYGLTGALYTSSEEKMARAREEFHVGNLYFNRKCTGAIVGAHPFGGFNLSGTDSKAGGPDYLQLFLQAKSVAQKLG